MRCEKPSRFWLRPRTLANLLCFGFLVSFLGYYALGTTAETAPPSVEVVRAKIECPKRYRSDNISLALTYDPVRWVRPPRWVCAARANAHPSPHIDRVVAPLLMSGLLTNSSVMKDRKKAPPFHELELKLLMRLYCDSYEEYHGRGKEDKKNLLRRFAREVSNLGFYQRTEKQIEERLRADCKRVRKHERARIHEGQEAVLNSLPSYLHQLYECRRNKANGSGLLGLHDDDCDLNDEDAPCTWNKIEVLTPREGTPAGEQPSSEAFMEMEDVEESATSTTAMPRKTPRKVAKASRTKESPSPSMDRRTVLYEEEIKLSLLRQQLALEELKLIVIKNDLARAQLERETIATERERFELERAKQEQYSEELKLFQIKQDLARAQLEKETIALERERLKFERERERNNETICKIKS